MNFSKSPFNIISDGKNMYLVRGNEAFKLKNPFLHRMDFSHLVDYVDMQTIGGAFTTPIKTGLRAEFSIEGEAREMECIESAAILIDFFQSASIRDLLKEIDKKIDTRKI